MSVESSSFLVASLAAAISSLPGRNFFSPDLEDFAGEGLIAFDSVLASDKLETASSSFGLDFMLGSGAGGVLGSVLSAFTLGGGSLCTMVDFEDGLGRTGMTGLIAGLVVTLR